MKIAFEEFAQSGLSRNDIYLAYKLLLGREPESQQVIDDHMVHKTLDRVRQVMVNSVEFKSQFTNFSDFGKKWVSTEVLDDYTMWVDLSDRFVSRGCLQNNWAESESNFFVSVLPSTKTVLDIGANIGWFSLLSAKHMHSGAVVHAFEANSLVASKLKRTVSDNKLENRVNVWNLALSNKAEELYVCWGKETDNPGGAHISQKRDDPSMVYQLVNAVALDDLMPELKPDLIKMHVEGAEPRVIQGARRLLKHCKPLVLSALHPPKLKAVSNASATQFIFQMTELGYHCFLLEGGKPTRKLKDFPSDLKLDLVSVVFERMN